MVLFDGVTWKPRKKENTTVNLKQNSGITKSDTAQLPTTGTKLPTGIAGEGGEAASMSQETGHWRPLGETHSNKKQERDRR